MPKNNTPLKRFWRWVGGQVVHDVPEDSALCVFDCRKGQCTLGEWEACDRRLHKAAGELMPADAAALEGPEKSSSSCAGTTPTGPEFVVPHPSRVFSVFG
jgi:hypothetical protein